MRIDVNISNLGRINKAKIGIRPITLLTGPNGTGKSFFTKSLYSILNVINKDVYLISITRLISLIKMQINSSLANLSYAGEADYISFRYLKAGLDDLQAKLNLASSEYQIQEYLNFTKHCSEDVDKLISFFDNYISSLEGKPKKESSIKIPSRSLNRNLTLLKSRLKDSFESYNSLLSENLDNEIKDNFQIPDLQDLIRFGESSARISVDDLIDVEINKNGVEFSLGEDFINDVSSLSRVVLFESPAYWKVRDALKAAKEQSNIPVFLRKEANNILTGVPKYFYDLDEALRAEVKTQAPITILEKTLENLKNELGGEFIFNGDNLIFKDKVSGKEISKNLISFGMTNIGMIHSLLKNNVITPGSFVFIDEPETNLHPRWQVLLMNVLIELAQHNVNIVIATHSIDMLKALEVGLSKNSSSFKDDFVSVHYFDTDGMLLEFESDKPFEQLLEARQELNASYEALYFEGIHHD
ncbi:AAA family ATPase [Aeromonas caviae]